MRSPSRNVGVPHYLKIPTRRYDTCEFGTPNVSIAANRHEGGESKTREDDLVDGFVVRRVPRLG